MVLSLQFNQAYLFLSAQVGQHVVTSVSCLDDFITICLQRKNIILVLFHMTECISIAMISPFFRYSVTISQAWQKIFHRVKRGLCRANELMICEDPDFAPPSQCFHFRNVLEWESSKNNLENKNWKLFRLLPNETVLPMSLSLEDVRK